MKKYIIIFLFLPVFVFGQNPINENLIKKYCDLINIERQHNEVINSVIYKALQNEYSNLSYVDFQVKAKNLYSEKKALKKIWKSYANWGFNDLIIAHFKKIGFTYTEAEKFKIFITNGWYLSDKERIELAEEKEQQQKIYDIRKKLYNLNELNPLEYQKIKDLLIKSIFNYISENYDNTSYIEQKTFKGTYDIILYKRPNYTYHKNSETKEHDNSTYFKNAFINKVVIDSLKTESLKTEFGIIEIDYAATYKDIPIYYTYGKIQVKKNRKGVIFIDLISDQKLIELINKKMEEYKNGYYNVIYVFGNVDTLSIERININRAK